MISGPGCSSWQASWYPGAKALVIPLKVGLPPGTRSPYKSYWWVVPIRGSTRVVEASTACLQELLGPQGCPGLANEADSGPSARIGISVAISSHLVARYEYTFFILHAI